MAGDISSIARLESFRENISKTATLQDLSSKFVNAIQQVFPHTRIGLVHRSAGEESWRPVIKSSLPERTNHPHIPGLEPSGFCTIHPSPDGLILFQKLSDSSYLGMVLSGDSSPSAYSDRDLASLRLAAALFEGAYQEMLHRQKEKALVFSLNQRILQLSSLIDTGIEIAKLDPAASPHRLALSRAVSLTNASIGWVRVTEEKRVLEEYSFPEGSPPSAAPGTKSIAAKFVFAGREYAFELFNKESRAGVVNFEDIDHLLLDALAKQVHASLDNKYLLERALEHERTEREISLAASIQRRIIPVSLPAIKGYEIAGINIPSRSVGGDYFDCIPLDGGRYMMVIADVSGKGVPAALLVSTLHAYLSAYLEGSEPLAMLAGKLNKALFRASTEDRFVTAFLAVLVPERGEIEYLSAGHNPVYVLRNDRSTEELKVGGIPLGMLEMDFPYQSERTTLGKGEGMLLYTDGVTEAENAHHELYEEKHDLSQYLASRKGDRAEQFVANLVKEIKGFTGAAPQNDDITALCIIRMP